MFVAVIFYPLLGIFLALATPDNILEYPLARGFTNAISFLVPLVKAIGQKTSIPSIQFIAAVLNVGAVLVCILGFICTWDDPVVVQFLESRNRATGYAKRWIYYMIAFGIEDLSAIQEKKV